MRLLVLGGTVYLSKAIARLALRAGHEVVVAARGHSGPPADGARFVPVDRDRPDGLEPLAGESFDAVVDVARFPGQVAAALDALADRAGHWSFVSTCGVYARQDVPGQTADTAPVREPAPRDSTDPDAYDRNKVACEHLVRDRFGDDAFIVRSGLLVGPEDPMDRFGYWPLRIADGGEILAPGDPAEPVQWIDVADLAGWLVDGARRRLSGTYDGIGMPISRAEFLTGIAEALDVPARFTWVPTDFLAEHEVAPWIGDRALGMWLPSPEYAGFLSRDTSAAIEAGLRPRPLADTVRRWTDWAASRSEPPALAADLPRAVESAVLTAWHDR